MIIKKDFFIIISVQIKLLNNKRRIEISLVGYVLTNNRFFIIFVYLIRFNLLNKILINKNLFSAQTEMSGRQGKAQIERNLRLTLDWNWLVKNYN